MKTQIRLLVLALTALFLFDFELSTARAQGTAFTYQGELMNGAIPASGNYDILLEMYDAASGGTRLGSYTNSATLSNGLFTATLDFGNQFSGASRFLEIGVRTNGAASFNRLTPRQTITATPYSITAASANSVNGTNITGTIPLGQLPPNVVTNGATNVFLTGTFNGAFGSFTNLLLGSRVVSNGISNEIRFDDKVGSEQIFIHARKNMDLETLNDGTAFVGHDYTEAIDHDSTLHIKHDSFVTVDDDLSAIVGSDVTANIAGNVNATIGGTLTLQAQNQNITTVANLANTVGGSMDTSIGVNQSSTINGSSTFHVSANATDTIDHDYNIIAGHYFSINSANGVGIGIANPQAPLHIYSGNNPTSVRIQSTGTPGFGRLEFVSNPQGDANEWRPAFIQSLDSGSFTGGLGFYVNGTGSGNKFATNEVMRIQNGRVGINKTNPGSSLDVAGGPTGNGVQGTSFDVNASGVYGENLTGYGYGVAGRASTNGAAVYGENPNAAGWAGYFLGNVRITGTLNPSSDRNVKQDFSNINSKDILEKVAALNIQTWSYNSDTSHSRHLGPVAQDFKAAFELGADDKTIATVDADGVALAAIQGLNQKLVEKDAELQQLKARLDKLERLLPPPNEH